VKDGRTLREGEIVYRKEYGYTLEKIALLGSSAFYEVKKILSSFIVIELHGYHIYISGIHYIKKEKQKSRLNNLIHYISKTTTTIQQFSFRDLLRNP